MVRLFEWRQESLMVSTLQPDIVVSSRVGRPIAVVETRNSIGMNAAEGVEYLREILTHGFIPAADYFILLTQHEGYVWTDESRLRALAPPIVTFPMTDIIDRYAADIDQEQFVSGRTLQYIAWQWLLELSYNIVTVPGKPEELLDSIGFVDAVRYAKVDMDPRY
jgi:hypothetical protein